MANEDLNVSSGKDGIRAIVVKTNVNTERNSTLEESMQSLIPNWILLIVSFIGDDHFLDESLYDVIKTAFRNWFRDTCIVTSGLDQNKLKMLVKVMHEFKNASLHNEMNTYFLGISRWVTDTTVNSLHNQHHSQVADTPDEHPFYVHPSHYRSIYVEGDSDELKNTKALFLKTMKRNRAVAQVVIGGDFDVLIEALETIRNGIALVVCIGTGGAAHALHEAYKRQKQCNDEETFSTGTNGIWYPQEDHFLFPPTDLQRAFFKIQQESPCITLVDVYNYDDIGLAIFSTAARRRSQDFIFISTDMNLSDGVPEQLKLLLMDSAIPWFTKPVLESELWQNNFKTMMFQALKKDRMEDFDAIVRRAAPMNEFVRTSLRDLYSKEEAKFILPRYLQRFSLDANGQDIEAQSWMNTLKPYEQLFLWAVSHLRQKIALHLWKRCHNPLMVALLACHIYAKILKCTSYMKQDVCRRCKAYQDEFESLATDLVNEAYKRDKGYCIALIRREITLWDSFNSMTWAHKLHLETFLATEACQNVLKDIWQATKTCKPSGKLKYDKLKMILNSLETPEYKYYSSSISYVVFLLMFSYIMLHDVHQKQISTVEVIVFYYFINYAVEAIAQIFAIPKRGIKKFIFYLKYRKWCILYLITAFFSVIFMTLRLTGVSASATLFFFCLTLILCYSRLFRIYFASPTIGPKLVMLKFMLKDSALFFAIMGPCILLCGTLLQILLNRGERTVDTTVLYNIFHYAYYAIFGELNLDKILESNNCTSHTDPSLCKTSENLLRGFYPVYLFFALIVLINLLIAIFSFAYNRVNDNSSVVWMYENYALVFEYSTYPVLPAPFSAIEIMYLVIHWKLYKPNSIVKSMPTFEWDGFEFECRQAVLNREKKTCN